MYVPFLIITSVSIYDLTSTIESLESNKKILTNCVYEKIKKIFSKTQIDLIKIQT